jgi:hypothetical protein
MRSKTLVLAARRSVTVKRLCDQQRRENIVPFLFISHRLGVDEGFETAVAFPTAPNVMDLPLIPIFGPFGGNQLIVALSAVHLEGRTTIGYHRRHGNPFRAPTASLVLKKYQSRVTPRCAERHT